MSDSKIHTEIRKTVPWKLAVVFALFSAAIVVAGIFYYSSQKRRIITEETSNLAAIASLKIGQIESWRKERVGDAEVIKENRPLIKTVRQFYSDNDKGLEKELTDWMKSIVNEYDYENALIADTSLRVRLSVNPSDIVLGDSLKREMKSALNNHSIVLRDLNRSKEIPYIHLDLIIPLFDSVNKRYIPVGVVVLRIDPSIVLFPLVNSWPTSSKSSETLLLRRERDSVLYLNELRLTENTALRLRLPLSNKDLLATKAAKGLIGTAEGVDYRNIPVVGSLHIVPVAQWYMVAKVDKAEILAPLKRYVVFIIIVVVLLILINASIFGFWIWQQRIKFYRSQLKNEVSIHELEERFTTAFMMSPVSVAISATTDNKFIDVNNTFLRDMEYNREEVIGRTASELNILADEDERLWIINELDKKGKVLGKVISYKTRTGKIIYGLSSVSVINVNGEPCNLSTIVNITDSKKAELKLIESEELFRKLFENMLNGFAYCKMIYEKEKPPDFMYLNVNEAFEILTGLKEVVGKRVSEAIPGIQEADPELLERYNRVSITGVPEVFETYVESLKMWFDISVYSPEKGYFVAVFDVITARKNDEESLRENEKRLREAQEMAHLGFWKWDIKSGDVEWSEEVYKIFHLDPKNFKPQIDSILSLSPWEEDNHRNTKLINIAIKSHEPGDYEQKFLRPDNSIGYYYSTFQGKYDENGDLIRIVGTVLDITERKLTESALRESEERFRTLYENATIGIYRTTADGKILMANPALVNMLGFESFEELAKRNLEQEGYELDYPRKKFIETLEEQGRIIGLESAWHKRDGSVLHVRESAVAIRDDKDKIIFYDGNVEDITERKKAEESLLLKNFVFDDSIAANSIADINGNITEVNDTFLRIWGYPAKDEVIGKAISDFIKNSSDSSVIVNALSEFGEWEGDYIALKNDGSTFIAHGLATRIKDEKGKPVGYQSAVLDVTDSKKAEEIIHKLNEELEQKVIQRTELLEAANKELEAFSYSVSHDLRAPLRSVHGYTKILVEEYESMLDDEGKRICGIISSSATQMGELIDDLLNFSRIGRSSMNPLLLDMKSMVISVFNEISSAKEKSGTKLKIGKLHKVFGDANLVKLVWTNLISNAIKYSSKENIPEISVSSQLKYDRITYSVTDNGVGFDMSFKHKLFGVFQRLHSESEFEGNGVGLAIVQRIILKHGGKVWAEGEVGKGATFYFSLPVSGDRQQATGDRQTKNQKPVA